MNLFNQTKDGIIWETLFPLYLLDEYLTKCQAFKTTNCRKKYYRILVSRNPIIGINVPN